MTDYFAFLGVPRSLTLAAGAVTERYFALSREYHPDFHTNAGDHEREQSLRNSSTLNLAYTTLKDRYERARHLLDLELPDRSDADRKRIPSSLLMEVMEMQETIAESGAGGEAANARLADIQHRLESRTAALDTQLDELGARWDAAASSNNQAEREQVLLALNELLNTRSYLRTLVATVAAAQRGETGIQH